MKRKSYIFVAVFLLCGMFASALSAQSLRHVKVDFSIERLGLINDTLFLFNDTMLVMKLNFRESDPSSLSALQGQITMVLCGCYCDTLLDSWPSGVGGGLFGSGTLSYISSTSSTGGSVFNPVGLGQGGPIRNRGMLGIKEITGGIPRSSEFVVPVTFRLE